MRNLQSLLITTQQLRTRWVRFPLISRLPHNDNTIACVLNFSNSNQCYVLTKTRNRPYGEEIVAKPHYIQKCLAEVTVDGDLEHLYQKSLSLEDISINYKEGLSKSELNELTYLVTLFMIKHSNHESVMD